MTMTPAERMREMAASAVEKRAIELGRKECCGRGEQSCDDEPPGCCGYPVYMISNEEAAAAIYALSIPDTTAIDEDVR